MLQNINAQNFTRTAPDGTEFPAGGTVEAEGLSIRWQKGPLRGPDGAMQEPNGTFVESVIAAAVQRIEWYQTACGKRFACRENALAITKLEEALHWLNARTQRRTAAGVEGTHAPDAGDKR